MAKTEMITKILQGTDIECLEGRIQEYLNRGFYINGAPAACVTFEKMRLKANITVIMCKSVKFDG